eukprot:569109-Pelagomonas_calceolata.AAC.1
MAAILVKIGALALKTAASISMLASFMRGQAGRACARLITNSNKFAEGNKVVDGVWKMPSSIFKLRTFALHKSMTWSKHHQIANCLGIGRP